MATRAKGTLIIVNILLVAAVAFLCFNLFFAPDRPALSDRRDELLQTGGIIAASFLWGIALRSLRKPKEQPNERNNERSLDKVIEAQALQVQETDALIRAAVARAEELNETIRAQALEAAQEVDARALAIAAREEAQAKIMEAQALQLQEAQAQPSTNAQSHLLPQISRQMREPLSAIISLSEQMMGNEDIIGEHAGDLEKICRAGATLLGAVNDIMDLSNIESGKFALNPAQYDTQRMISDIISLHAKRVGEGPVRFVPQIGEGLHGALFGDESRVKQIFGNLLCNAFQHTREGSVEWRLSSEREGDSVWLVSSVSGTVEVAPSNDLDELGLSMSVTKRLVEVMDGTIAVERANGKGSTFTVRLRQGFVGDRPIGKEAADALQAQQHLHLPDARVLVVDDTQADLDAAKGLLARYGMRVDCVASGEKAIRLIQAGVARYSAILMDHRMAGLDGVETTRIIRQEIGTRFAQTVPIIALTDESKDAFVQKGFQDTLSKPIGLTQLDAAIRRWVCDQGSKIVTPAISAVPEAKPHPLPLIEGIDMETALQRIGGDQETLLAALRSYALMIPPVLDEIRQVSEEGLPAYAIAVNAIKGSSRSICAERVGDQAEVLENAAMTGALAFVQENNRPFVETLDKLLAQMQAVLRINGTLPKPHKAAPSALVLNMLSEACADSNYEAANEMVEKLERYTYETGGQLVEWLGAQLQAGDLAQIQDRLQAERLYNEGAS